MSKLPCCALNPVVSIVALLALSWSTGCQTAPARAPIPAPADRQVSGNSGGAEVARAEMEVTVTGADATKSGDTLKIDYPVLQDMNDRIPDWVINPGLGGVIGAVGVAPPKGMGTKEQLDEARLNGRIEIVNMLEGRVQRVGRAELEGNSRATAASRSEQSRKNILGIDRNILDSILAGSRQRALWFDPDNGECYVWMVLDGAVLDKVDHHVKDSVSVFSANTPITSEYRPQRRVPEVPRVSVEAPDTPAATTPPRSPVDELETKLKDIETIPSNKNDSSNDSQSDSNR